MNLQFQRYSNYFSAYAYYRLYLFNFRGSSRFGGPYFYIEDQPTRAPSLINSYWSREPSTLELNRYREILGLKNFSQLVEKC